MYENLLLHTRDAGTQDPYITLPNLHVPAYQSNFRDLQAYEVVDETTDTGQARRVVKYSEELKALANIT
jgi:hypothetical protein